MSDATRLLSTPQPVDNTDWLKTAAIICTAVGHIGFFFIDEDSWWSVVGRFAAPILFFFLGYAQSQAVPLRWIGLGIILTLLESANASWTWVAPNILLSFAFIRIVRPYVLIFVQKHGWAAFVALVCALFVMLPLATKIVDYGTEGWLWAVFGLCQRRYIDARAATNVAGGSQSLSSSARATKDIASLGVMRLLASIVAALGYIWQEQVEFSFSQIQFVVFIVGIVVLSLCLCLFTRGPSRIQPPGLLARVLRFIGLYTLEIYAIPGSPHNPKFLWVDDAKIVGDRIAEVSPVPGNCFT